MKLPPLSYDEMYAMTVFKTPAERDAAARYAKYAEDRGVVMPTPVCYDSAAWGHKETKKEDAMTIPWLDTEKFHAEQDKIGHKPYCSVEVNRMLALIAIAEAASDMSLGETDCAEAVKRAAEKAKATP